MKNKILFTLLMLAGLSCIAQNSHKKFKIETSTVIEEMKQSMDGDYSDVFSSVWNDTCHAFHVRHQKKKLFSLQAGYESYLVVR